MSEPESNGVGASGGLAEAQIRAIEQAFADRDRELARLRKEVTALRGERDTDGLGARLDAIETRIDEQEASLRRVLARLVEFFESSSERDVN